MRRICIIFMALAAMTMLTSFIVMDRVRSEKSLESLWYEYDNAQNLDQVRRMADILEKIKMKALKERASWDYYKACDRYVDVKARRNWKQRDTLMMQMKQEVEEYDEPLLTYLFYRDNYHDDTLRGKVLENAGRLRKGYNQDVFKARGPVLSGAVPYAVRNDYEYVLWDMLRMEFGARAKGGFSDVYELLVEEVAGSYPQAALAEYYCILNNYEGSEDEAALRDLMERYQGQALALLPAWTLIEEEFKKNQDAESSEYFLELKKRLESYEHERKMFKDGIDRRIADDLSGKFVYLTDHLESEAVLMEIKDGVAKVGLRNLARVKVRVTKGDETVYETVLENPVRSFYALDSLSLELPALDDGDYRVRCLDGKDEIGQCRYPKFTLSVALRDDSGCKRAYVADYRTGKPLEKVDMKLYKGDRIVEEASDVVLRGFTALPENIASAIEGSISSYYLVCSVSEPDGRSRRSNDVYVSRNSGYGQNASERAQFAAKVMLDRAAFKPGETVRFKAVVYDKKQVGELALASPGQKVTVKLLDSQSNELKASDYVLNEFGSLAGEFVLDGIKRNGSHHLIVFNGASRIGSTSFVVDEFVLPTFDVSFEEGLQPFLPGDTVVVKGIVQSYSGHSLSSADVEAKVMYDGRLVKEETLNLASDGSFAVSFQDEEDDYGSYSSYKVEIKVTDLTGETMSFYSWPTVMRRPELRVSLDNQAEGSCAMTSDGNAQRYIMSEDTARVTFAVSAGGGRDYAGLPLKFSLEKDGKPVCEAEAVTGNVTEVDFSGLASGVYKLVAEIILVDAHGKELTDKAECLIIKVRDSDVELGEAFENLFRVVEGDDVALQFGAGKGPVWAVAELFGDKGQFLKSEMVRLDAGQMRILKYDYKKEYPDGVRLNVLYFRNSGCHTFTHVWKRPVPSREIPIEILRFEERVMPRSSCSVQLKVPAGCELLASVFDASTERIRSNSWSRIYPSGLSVASVRMNTAAGTDGSGYAAMMGDALNVYNEDYTFDGPALGGIVVGYGHAVRGLKRMNNTGYAVADYVSVEEESAADEAIPFQIVSQDVSVREDFATSLAFEPFLRPSEDGVVNLDFKTSDKISSFVVSVFAHDKDMNNSVLRREMLVTLPVKVDLVQPQYLYAGDKYVLNASVSSVSDMSARGVARLDVYASDSYEGADPVLSREILVDVPSGGSVPVSFEMDVPADIQILGIKLTFAGAYESEDKDVNDVVVTDGVFVTVPVYRTEQVLEEAHSGVLLHGMDHDELLADLRGRFVNVSSAGAEHEEISIMDMLREALPLVVETDAKDAVSQSEVMYVNLLAAGLREHEGKPVREYLEAAMAAAGRILACANSDGGFAWFEGMKSSPVVTAVVLERFAGLRDRKLLDVVSEELGEDALDMYDAAVTGAVKYLDSVFFSDPDRPSWYGSISLWQYMQVRSMYVGVPFDKAAAQKAAGAKGYKEFKKVVKAFLSPKKGERWTDGAVLNKVRMIRVINAMLDSPYGVELADAWGLKSLPKLRRSMAAELSSLKEYAVEHQSGGMYYPNAVLPFRGLLESEAYAHAMICDLFKEMSSDQEPGAGLADMADAVRIWIMLQKETQQWASDPGFVEAMASVYDGSDAVKDTKVVVLSKRYSKPFDQIKAVGNGFRVSTRYYREAASAGSEPERVELVEGDVLKLGEKIVAEYSLWSGENRSFVRLSVPRAACLRPEKQLSGWAGGWFHPLAYGIYSVSPYAYREVKADRTLYWIDVFPEEKSKIEETFFVTQEGVFAVPVTEVESLYAPHYRADDGAYGKMRVVKE